MLARVSPSSFIAPESMPLTCTTGTTPPITDGNCARPNFSSSSGLSGASDEPKSTVPALIWAMPPPDPSDWSLTCLPVAVLSSEDHLVLTGKLNAAQQPGTA